MNPQSFRKNKVNTLVWECVLLSGLSFIGGDIIGIFYSISIGAIIGIFLWIVSFLYKKPFWYTCMISLVFMSGYLLGSSALDKKMQAYNHITQTTYGFTGKVYTEWILSDELYKKELSRVYRLSISKIDNIDTRSPYKSTQMEEDRSIFVEIPENLHLTIGDTLGFTGKILQNIKFPVAGYDRYSFFHGGYGISRVATFTRIERVDPWIIQSVRIYWKKVFRSYFPDSIWGTLLGMTIGTIDLLSQEVKDNFIKSGISHILVVSGSNIAFLILLITFFLKYFPVYRWIRMGLIIGMLVFYGTLVGWDVSVIRAVIMGIISYVVVEYGLPSLTLYALVLSWVILTIISPLWPVYDAGFWLSFGATFGILVFHPYIEKFGGRFHLPKWCISLVSLSFGASLGSLPAMVYHFWTISLGGLVANILIAGLLGWILFASVFFVLIQYISTTLGYFLGLLIYLPTRFIVDVGSFFSGWIIIHISTSLQTPLALFLLGMYSVFLFEKQKQG